MVPRLTGRRVAALSLAGALALAGCSDDSGGAPQAGDGSSSGPGSSPATASSSPYLPVPDGVDLTSQGSSLRVGDTAVVAYEPRQGTVGALEITVDRLEKTTFKKSFSGWQLSAAARATNPYFVRASVKNVGDTDLGGRPVPLYIVDGNNTLVEASTFSSSFKPCPSTPLPKKFSKGAKADVCLVYLSPGKGDLTAVSFRPTEAFDPITWTGDLKEPVPPKARATQGGKAKGGKAKGGNAQGGQG
jgi:hypothetical protein